MKRIILLILFTSIIAVNFAQKSMSSAEYFIGQIDPGAGNGNALNVSDSNWANLTEELLKSLDLSELSSGVNLINVRVKDDTGAWGPVFKKVLFYNTEIPEVSEKRNFIEFEYFWGTFDPGEGNGNKLISTDGTYDKLIESAFRDYLTWSISTKPALFNIRAKDGNNLWGPLFKKVVFPYGANTNLNLIQEGDSLITCQNSEISLHYSGPTGYVPKWLNEKDSIEFSFIPSKSGYYSCSVNIDGQTYKDSIYVSFYTPPISEISPSGHILACPNSNIRLIANTGPDITYQWYFNNNKINNAMSSSYLPTSVGKYTVLTTDNIKGCSTMSEPTELITTFNINSKDSVNLCELNTLDVPFGSTNKYKWYHNGILLTNDTLNELAIYNVGNYSCQITNGDCSVTTSTVKIFSKIPSDEINQYQLFINGEKLQNLDVSGQNVTWYQTMYSADILSLSDTLVSKTFYYFTRDLDGCTSSRIKVGVYDVDDISLTCDSILENSESESLIGKFHTSEINGSDIFKYNLISDLDSIDNTGFIITHDSLLVNQSFDFESKSSYNIHIGVTDSRGKTLEKSIIIKVIDVNESPNEIILSNDSINENSPMNTLIGILTTDDVDANDKFVYSIVTGDGATDNSSFKISNDSILLIDSIDFEKKNTYSIRIRTTDKGGSFIEQVFTINLKNINDKPKSIELSNLDISENSPLNAFVSMLSTTDQDIDESFTYSFDGGLDDNNNFSIRNDSLFLALPVNYEQKNLYTIQIKSVDKGGLFVENQFKIRILDVNESPSDLSLSNPQVNENSHVGTLIGTLTTADVDAGDYFKYSFVNGAGGEDNGSFYISNDSVLLNTNVNYESKTIYNIRIKTEDSGQLSFTKDFVINVSNVNETPDSILLSNLSMDENIPLNTFVGEFTTIDQDFDESFTYKFYVGIDSDDNGRFRITNDSLFIIEHVNYEGKNQYVIDVVSTDKGNNPIMGTFTIKVNDINETPTDLTLSNETILESTPFGSFVGFLSTTDEDSGDTFTYSINKEPVTIDSDCFSIRGDSLFLSTTPNYEVKSEYEIRIKTTDAGGLFYEKDFTLKIIDVNEVPYDITLSNDSVLENNLRGVYIGKLTTSDQDKDETFRYTLDNDSILSANDIWFEIRQDSLFLNTVTDYEQRSSYTFNITTHDKGGLIYTKSFDVYVINRDESITDILLDSVGTFYENQTKDVLIGVLSAVSEFPNARYDYVLPMLTDSGVPDFYIVGNKVYFSRNLNFEENSSYRLFLTSYSIDGGTYFQKEFWINIEDVNEVPTNINVEYLFWNPLINKGSNICRFTTIDQDINDTIFTYTLVAGDGSSDNNKFEIVDNKMIALNDIKLENETKFYFRIQTTDNGGLSYSNNYTFTINDLNVGINVVSKLNISIFPNPTRDYINITGLNTDGEVAITDLTGHQILHQTITSNDRVDIRTIFPGVYIMNVKTNDGEMMFKVVKE